MIYCLDANIFIEAKNLYYHFNICPGFWKWLDQQNGTIGSVIPAFDELTGGNDKLKDWAKDRKIQDFLMMPTRGWLPMLRFMVVQW